VGGGRQGSRTGRFNQRGRGAEVVALFAGHGLDGGRQRDSAGRFRARRVVVKARVVRSKPQRRARGLKMRATLSWAVDAHLRYLERGGLTRDGDRGKPIPLLKTRLTEERLWNGDGKIAISFDSLSRPRTQLRWPTFAVLPGT
jgi:hypothetical protein